MDNNNLVKKRQQEKIKFFQKIKAKPIPAQYIMKAIEAGKLNPVETGKQRLEKFEKEKETILFFEELEEAA